MNVTWGDRAMGASEWHLSTEDWIKDLHQYLKPYWSHLVDGPWAEGVTNGTLTLAEMQGWMIQLYPFIHSFPKFLAEALIKCTDDYTRGFYITNIRVEKAHAEQWLWMATGFGAKREEMLALANGERQVLRDVQSLTDWLWYINTKGSLAEAVAATSFAIEGVTGDLARKVVAGFQYYRNEPQVDLGPKTYRWMRQHAQYDDEHPKIALEIVQRYATTAELRTRAMVAAKRSLELLDNALMTAYRAYSASTANAPILERRKQAVTIAFPDRRFARSPSQALSEQRMPAVH
jgi:pyrroloquinoline quinone (PQQ) biosynthesis protein C